MYFKCEKTEKKLYAIEGLHIIKIINCAIGSGNHKLLYNNDISPLEDGFANGGKAGDWITPIGSFKLENFNYNESGFYIKNNNEIINIGKIKIDLNCKNEKGQNKGIKIYQSFDNILTQTHGSIKVNSDDMLWIYNHANPGDTIIIESVWESFTQSFITEGKEQSKLNISYKQITYDK